MNGKKKKLIGFACGLFALFSHAFAAELDVPPPTPSRVSIDAGEVIEPVNRRVFGVCLIYPPFDNSFVSLFKGVLDGVSAHVWAYANWEKQTELNERHWQRFMPFAKEVGIVDISVMTPNSKIDRTAKYNSEKDNNLDKQHQPSTRAKYVRILNKTPHKGFPDGYGVAAWTTWDEPQFPQNGAWPSADYARYIVDCAHAIHAVDASVGVGASLHEGNMEWNKKLLSDIAALDLRAVDFVEIHPFSFSWIPAKDRIGSYYARVAESEIRRPHIRERVKLAQRLGHGNWRVRANAWTIHPPGWKPPYECSTDMAVAVHAASMFGVYWEEGVDAACFFQFSNRKPTSGPAGHFILVKKSDKGLVLLPTGEVFMLYGKYFRGDRLKTDVVSPRFAYDEKRNIPLTVAHAAYDPKNERLVIIAVNKHRDSKAPIDFNISHFRATDSHAKKISITADSPESRKPIVTESKLTTPLTPDFSFSDQLPPHSVTAYIIKGVRPVSEDKLFNGKKEFVKEWNVNKFINVSNVNENLLSDKPSILPNKKDAAPTGLLSATPSGFVDVAAKLDRSGLRTSIATDKYMSQSHVWIFSPVPQKIDMNVGIIGSAALFLNNIKTAQIKDGKNPSPLDNELSLSLRQGWNKISMRNINNSSGMGFWLAVEKKGDLIFSAANRRPAWPSEWIVKASEGTYTNAFKAQRTADNSKQTALHLSRAGTATHRRGYLKWKLAPLPKNIDRNKLDVEIVLTPKWHRGKGQAWLRRARQGWNEKTLNANSQPEPGKDLKPKVDVKDPKWIFSGDDIADMVFSWMDNPNANHGVSIETNISQHAGVYSDNAPEKYPIIRFSVKK